METSNEAIGRNVAAARERAGMSQRTLAQRMRGHGHDWQQATVWKTETGERNLKLVEAVDLANCLEVNMWEITRSKQTVVELALAQVEAAAVVAEEAVEAYVKLRARLMRLPVDGEHEEVIGAYEDESARVIRCGPYGEE